MEKTKLMVERGWKKHTKFWGQEEAEEHQAALVSRGTICYYCLAELEEKYGMEQALRQRVIKF